MVSIRNNDTTGSDVHKRKSQNQRHTRTHLVVDRFSLFVIIDRLFSLSVHSYQCRCATLIVHQMVRFASIVHTPYVTGLSASLTSRINLHLSPLRSFESYFSFLISFPLAITKRTTVDQSTNRTNDWT